MPNIFVFSLRQEIYFKKIEILVSSEFSGSEVMVIMRKMMPNFIWEWRKLRQTEPGHARCGTEASDQRGGEWEPIKISSKFESSAYIPKSPKPSSVLTKVWSSYWKAKPTQNASNERAKPRSKSEANRESCRTDLPGPVWPVHWTGLTGLDCSRTSRPVWPVLPTGLTGGTQKIPKNLDSNGQSRPNDHENRWNLGDSFAPTPWTYPQKISS